MSEAGRGQSSELLTELAAIVDDEARRGLEGLGERAATRLAFAWGGQKLYIPFDRVRRNREIYALFTGSNYGELARRFHMSENTVRQVVNQEIAKRRIRQFSLF